MSEKLKKEEPVEVENLQETAFPVEEPVAETTVEEEKTPARSKKTKFRQGAYENCHPALDAGSPE